MHALTADFLIGNSRQRFRMCDVITLVSRLALFIILFIQLLRDVRPLADALSTISVISQADKLVFLHLVSGMNRTHHRD